MGVWWCVVCGGGVGVVVWCGGCGDVVVGCCCVVVKVNSRATKR